MPSNTDLGFNVYALDRASKTFLELAGKVELLGRKLDQVDRKRVNVDVDVDTARAQSQLAAFTSRLEAADSRMANLVQTGLALAPALVPLGAAAVPALAGLTTQLGMTVGAAGATVLAFQGVGDALEALNKYQVDPSAENLAKLRQELDTLGPAGQEFVFFLQDLRPQLQDLQDVAEAGLFPGAQDSITELLDLMPVAESTIGHLTTTLGTLAREAGDNLNDARWVEFFEFLDREAGPTLTAMGHTLGNVVEGLANLTVAVNPLADDFTSGLLRMSKAFREWTAGLDSSEGFQHFVDYVRDSGPQAMETLGAIANALVSLVEAAAPVGQIVLPGLEALANTFSAIAQSPLGPVLVSIAAAIGVVGRSMALLKAVGLRGGDSIMARMFGGAVAPIKDAKTALLEVTTAQDRARMSATQLAEAEQKRSASIRGGLVQLGKGAALMAGFALAQSDYVEKTGLSNTATLGLAGAMGGPLVAAAGAAIGLTMDLVAVNNDLADAIDRAHQAAESPFDLSATESSIAQLQSALDDSFKVDNSSIAGVIQTSMRGWSDIFTDTADDAQKSLSEMREQMLLTRHGLVEFYAALNDGDMSMLQATDEELTRFATDIAPALRAAGIDIKDVILNHEDWDTAVAAVRSYNEAMDSAHGRSAAVGDALAGMQDALLSNADAADVLKSALDSLFGVELTQSEATDAWVSKLHELRKQIADTNGALKGNSQAALDNRASIRESVDALQQKIQADAAAGVSGDKLAAALLRGRDAIIKQAVAAGASEKDVRAYLKTLGMTPKNLETIVTTPGLMDAKDQVKALGKLYGLTPKEVRTLIDAKDDATGKTKAVQRVLDKLDGREAKALLKAIDQASSVIDAINAKKLYDKTLTIRTNHYDFFSSSGSRPNLPGSADGSMVPKDGGPYTDRFPYLLAPGEEIISNRHGEADRFRAMRSAGMLPGLADGGTVLAGLAGGGTAMRYTVDQELAILQLQQQIRQLLRDLHKTGDDALHGLNRAIAQTQLEQTRHELHAARREPIREARSGIRDTISGLRDARSGFRIDGDMTVRDVAEQLREFRNSIRDAGGMWTRRLDHMGDRLIRQTRAVHDSERALERETKKRDRLRDELDSWTSKMEDLQRTMDSFSSQVAGNFLSDPFGGGYTVSGGSGSGAPAAPDPALIAAQDQLQAAESRLAGIRGRTDIDPLERSYLASRAVAEVANLRDQVDQLSRGADAMGSLPEPVERTVSGLEAFEQALQSDIDRLKRMDEATDTLLGNGLDPHGGLFSGLVSSGNVDLAEQMAQLSPARVDELEQLFSTRGELVAEYAAKTTQAVYGEQQAMLQKHLDAVQKELRDSKQEMKHQTAVIERRTERLENTNRNGFEHVGNQIAGLRDRMSALERERHTNDQKSGHRKKGR